jgi:hypothetical protein
MVTRKRTKHLDRQPPARKPRALLNDGDWLGTCLILFLLCLLAALLNACAVSLRLQM